MPLEKVGSNLLAVVIVLIIFVWIYAKNKGMTLSEVIKEITSNFRRDEDG